MPPYSTVLATLSYRGVSSISTLGLLETYDGISCTTYLAFYSGLGRLLLKKEDVVDDTLKHISQSSLTKPGTVAIQFSRPPAKVWEIDTF